MRLAAAFALALLMGATASGHAAAQGAAPGAASGAAPGGDRRVAVDPNQPPWNAVARVQTTIGGRCSGVLIAPSVVLTAAHCLYNRRTRALLQPVSLHVLFGYQRAGYHWHREVARITIGPGFDGQKAQPQPADWARLELAAPVPVMPLPLVGGVATAGMAVALAGYNQDRTQLLMADLTCQVLRVGVLAGGARFVTHDCAGTRGTSGGPLLARQGNSWAVIGINIAAGKVENLALDAPFGN